MLVLAGMISFVFGLGAVFVAEIVGDDAAFGNGGRTVFGIERQIEALIGGIETAMERMLRLPGRAHKGKAGIEIEISLLQSLAPF